MKNLISPRIQKIFVAFLSFLLLFQTTACNYFWVRPVAPEELASIYKIGKMYKYFILHDDQEQYTLSRITVDSTAVYGLVGEVGKMVHYYNGRSDRYEIKTEKPIVHEVHVYLDDGKKGINPGKVKIALEDIYEIRVIEKDSGRTTATYVLGTIGVLAGLSAIALIIMVALKSSCPYMYVDNGEAFVFEGEIFGGAINRNMERDDYMPLPSIRPVDGAYRIRISNELKERQYTNLAQLLVANHPEGTKVLLDNKGNPHLIRSEILPESALTFGGKDVGSALTVKENNVHLFNEEDFKKNGIELTFSKPESAKTANLVLTAKNTFWLDYIYGEFISKFGNSYNSWMEKRKVDPREERMELYHQHGFPLSIYIMTDQGWKMVDHLSTIGPLADRDFVVPLDLSAISGEKLEVKIETGFMFWELDYAAIDFSKNVPIDLKVIKTNHGLSSDGIDPISALAKSDDLYLEQLEIGDVVELKYDAPLCPKGQQQSVFLHSRGYYELIRDFKGLPKIGQLIKFKEPGYMMQYSRESYLQMTRSKNEMLSLNK